MKTICEVRGRSNMALADDDDAFLAVRFRITAELGRIDGDILRVSDSAPGTVVWEVCAPILST